MERTQKLARYISVGLGGSDETRERDIKRMGESKCTGWV